MCRVTDRDYASLYMAETYLSFDEAGLADDLLLQAVSGLMSTGNANDLGLRRPETSQKPPVNDLAARAARSLYARNLRLGFARTSVLFAALGDVPRDVLNG